MMVHDGSFLYYAIVVHCSPGHGLPAQRLSSLHGGDLWERTFPTRGSLGNLGGISEEKKDESAIRSEIRCIRRKKLGMLGVKLGVFKYLS